MIADDDEDCRRCGATREEHDATDHDWTPPLYEYVRRRLHVPGPDDPRCPACRLPAGLHAGHCPRRAAGPWDLRPMRPGDGRASSGVSPDRIHLVPEGRPLWSTACGLWEFDLGLRDVDLDLVTCPFCLLVAPPRPAPPTVLAPGRCAERARILYCEEPIVPDPPPRCVGSCGGRWRRCRPISSPSLPVGPR